MVNRVVSTEYVCTHPLLLADVHGIVRGHVPRTAALPAGGVAKPLGAIADGDGGGRGRRSVNGAPRDEPRVVHLQPRPPFRCNTHYLSFIINYILPRLSGRVSPVKPGFPPVKPR
eukprot:6949658-Pyramimonas_sp.AAC.1